MDAVYIQSCIMIVLETVSQIVMIMEYVMRMRVVRMMNVVCVVALVLYMNEAVQIYQKENVTVMATLKIVLVNAVAQP